MMKKNSTLKKISFLVNFNINDGDDRYIFRGFLYALTPSEICKLVPPSFDFKADKRRILNRKIELDLQEKLPQQYISLFSDLIDEFDHLKTYSLKGACSTLLNVMCPYMVKSLQKKLIGIFILSEYKAIRDRAYKILSESWYPEFKEVLIKVLKIYKDFAAGVLVAEKLDSKELKPLLKIIIGILDQEDPDYFFELKVIRNKLYAKVSEYIPDTINKLKLSDPISYLYVQVQTNKNFDKELAMKLYKINPSSRRFIPKLLGQAGMWNELLELAKNNG